MLSVAFQDLLLQSARPEFCFGTVGERSRSNTFPGPGGYLQWEEAEQPNIWAYPFNSVAQSVILRFEKEKLTNGLSLR